jgi:hypothetical protein
MGAITTLASRTAPRDKTVGTTTHAGTSVVQAQTMLFIKAVVCRLSTAAGNMWSMTGVATN